MNRRDFVTTGAGVVGVATLGAQTSEGGIQSFSHRPEQFCWPTFRLKVSVLWLGMSSSMGIAYFADRRGRGSH